MDFIWSGDFFVFGALIACMILLRATSGPHSFIVLSSDEW